MTNGGGGDRQLMRRDLRAMNTDIELMCTAPGAERRLDRSTRWLNAFEGRFSRFRATSELSALNASAGTPFRASPQLLQIVSLALDFSHRTDGLFDPTILRELESAGYDRSFEQLPLMKAAARSSGRRGSWLDVRIDASAGTILLPEGLGIDLGGIGKGWAVDRVGTILGTPSLVNCGGDVLARGTPPDDTAWRVGVSNPFQPEDDLMVLQVVDRGVATSSSLKRRWKVGDAYVHHLIDPRTGTPSTSNAVQVTVVAASTVEADIHAKVALLRGATEGMEYLNEQDGVEGLAVRSDGAQFQSARFESYWRR